MNDTFRNLFYKILGKIFKNQRVEVPIKFKRNPKILIFRYDKIGDMVVSFPSLELLRDNLPEAEIWILASPINFFLLENYPIIDRFVVLPRNFFKKAQLLIALRKQKFDLIINYVFYRTTKAGVWANLINPKAIKVNVGHQTRNEIYSKLFNVLFPITLRGQVPMSEFLCHYLCWVFGLTFNRDCLKKYSIKIPVKSDEKARKFLSNISYSKKILVNISARKKWSIENYRNFILLAKNDLKEVGLIFVAHPKDFGMLKKIVQRDNRNVFIFDSDENLFDLVALIRLVDLVFTPDTSIVHFANAFAKPIVMMYYEGDLNEWLPNNSKCLCLCSKNPDNYYEIKPEYVVKGIKKLFE